MSKGQSIDVRLLNKVKINEKGCWVWTGSRFKKQYGDYAQIRLGGKLDGKCVKAHKVAYEHFIGKVPEGLELDHLCHNTLCINPSHLEPVTHAVNMKRRKDSGLPYCKHGHLYTKDTTYINPKGRRECKECRKTKVKLSLKYH